MADLSDHGRDDHGQYSDNHELQGTPFGFPKHPNSAATHD
jgi:hypothetical protein